MKNQYVNLDTLKFLMHEVHQGEEIFDEALFANYDREGANLFLDAIKDFSDQELFPYIKEMDEKPAYFKDGRIRIHPQFEKIMKQSGELGLVSAFFPESLGGLQMPSMLFHAAYFLMEAANNHVTGYLGLTAGAANLITSFGNDELKSTYLPKMLNMEWTGTMCLTEPQAGSSLSDIVTSASPQEDGSYKINGQKIFISSGDHQFAENIIHLTLARIDGAPVGTKGVSLFVVPAKKLEGDGLGERQVITAGEFEKLGQRGYCTSHLVFEEAEGYLVGEPHKGLSYMFQMMNEARIATGRMGAGIASAAYYASLAYAKERPQGRKLNTTGKKDLDEGQTLIINHPDVKRMLLFQKAIVEGSAALVSQASYYVDKEMTAADEEAKHHYHLLLELLTPVTKTYPSEKGLESVSQGLQVLGGYGFCMDFILQQYYRDMRIISIYEGTTGIQSLDLLGRKVTLENGKALELLANEMQGTIKEAMAIDELKPYANELVVNLGTVQEVLGALMPIAQSGNFEKFLADATPFMDLFGTIVVGWQWLKMATAAEKAISAGRNVQNPGFYEGKVHTMKFFYKYEMSRTKGLAKTIMNDIELTLDLDLALLD
jgi:alkylation response protein AidB-like acyl-CoA dehydrogenase